jgi:hypothetical protein
LECSASAYSVHCAGLLDIQNILSADTGISRLSEGNSFGDHLISEPVGVTPSSIVEAPIVLCSVFMIGVSQCPIRKITVRLVGTHPRNLYYFAAPLLFLVGNVASVMSRKHYSCHVVADATNMIRHVQYDDWDCLSAISCEEMVVVVCASVDCTFFHFCHTCWKLGTQTNSRRKNVETRYATGFEKSCKYAYIFNS